MACLDGHYGSYGDDNPEEKSRVPEDADACPECSPDWTWVGLLNVAVEWQTVKSSAKEIKVSKSQDESSSKRYL